MYDAKKEYRIRDELRDHLPEWVRILQDYFRKGYHSSLTKSNSKESKK